MTIPDSGRMMANGDICLSCTPEEEKQIISELRSKRESCLKEGDLYYVISNRWYAGWQRYVGEDVYQCSTDNGDSDMLKAIQRSGPIDNKDIPSDVNEGQDNDLELRRLLEYRDYVFLVHEIFFCT